MQFRKTSDLPVRIPIFPLSGALLLPRWQLPLNIFEPRYLNMIDDALAGDRFIGMIQQMPNGAGGLSAIGCAGRLTSWSETVDSRYLIVLTGVARFELAEELDVETPYRQVAPKWDAFDQDLTEAVTLGLPSRDTLLGAFRDYIARNEIEADFSGVEDAPLESLINALSAACPFSPIEKQAILEAQTLKERANRLLVLLAMDGRDEGSGAIN